MTLLTSSSHAVLLVSALLALSVSACDSDADDTTTSDTTTSDTTTSDTATSDTATSDTTADGTTTSDADTGETDTDDTPISPTTVSQAVNSFQNAGATGGAALTVDVQGPVAISDGLELPGFAFGTYDVDISANSLTMTLVADLEQLQITLYDETTFDRYYYAFDEVVTSAELADTTEPGFSATIEILEPGAMVTTAGTFVDGLPTDFNFEHGGVLITIGEGTDLTEISENGGSLTVNF